MATRGAPAFRAEAEALGSLTPPAGRTPTPARRASAAKRGARGPGLRRRGRYGSRARRPARLGSARRTRWADGRPSSATRCS
jgi:hypothetical protein